MSASANKLQPTVFMADRVWRENPHGWYEALRRLMRRSPWNGGVRGYNRTIWRRFFAGGAIAVSGIASGACGPKVLVSPRLDLAEYGEVGLVGFTVDNARGALGQVATNRFVSEVFSGQDRIAIVELGEAHEVLREIDAAHFNLAAYRAIGEVYDVPAVFLGHLEVSGVQPRAAIWRFPGVEARVSVNITVRLVATENGATLWSNSGRATATVGELGWAGGDLVFSAQNPDDAYGALVDLLIWDLTRDLRPTWVRG